MRKVRPQRISSSQRHTPSIWQNQNQNSGLLHPKCYYHSSTLSLMHLLNPFHFSLLFVSFFLNIFIDYAITVVPFPPHSTPSCPLPPSHIPPYSSFPWVILISSLASTFPTLFLPSLSIFHLSFMLFILCKRGIILFV